MKTTQIVLSSLAMAAMLVAGSSLAQDKKSITQPEANYQAGSSPLAGEPMYQSTNPKAPPLTQAEFDIVRSLGTQGGRRFLVKQGHASAICELDLSGLEDFITVLSATTDNVALLDTIRERYGNDPFQWLPVLLAEVQDRRLRNAGRAA